MKEVIYKIVSTLMYKNRQILPIMIEIRIAGSSERRPQLEGGTEDFSGGDGTFYINCDVYMGIFFYQD